ARRRDRRLQGRLPRRLTEPGAALRGTIGGTEAPPVLLKGRRFPRAPIARRRKTRHKEPPARPPSHKAEVAEWQTRRIQNPLSARACRFESDLRHSPESFRNQPNLRPNPNQKQEALAHLVAHPRRWTWSKRRSQRL